jgi:hypothetical protein
MNLVPPAYPYTRDAIAHVDQFLRARKDEKVDTDRLERIQPWQ